MVDQSAWLVVIDQIEVRNGAPLVPPPPPPPTPPQQQHRGTHVRGNPSIYPSIHPSIHPHVITNWPAGELPSCFINGSLAVS